MSEGFRDVAIIAALVAAVLLVAALVLAVRLVRVRRALRAAGLPEGRRWVFWGALAYLVLPTDLIPDPVYLDDIGVLLLALRSMGAGRAGQYAAQRTREHLGGRRGSGTGSKAAGRIDT